MTFDADYVGFPCVVKLDSKISCTGQEVERMVCYSPW